MNDRASVIEKIRKMLEHTVENGATEAEAIAFALKAQKLIAEHDVQRWELYEELDEGIVEEMSEVACYREWRSMLAEAISDNFRCRIYERFVHVGKLRRVPHTVFVGRRCDASAASLVFSHLYQVGDRLGRQAKKDQGFPEAYDSFCFGFAEGVRRELEKQCHALMLVRPKAVDDFYDGISLASGRTMRTRHIDGAIYSDGEVEGGRAVRAGRIEEADALCLTGKERDAS